MDSSLNHALQLKSICVPLSRQALQHLRAPQESQRELIKQLQTLYSFLCAARNLDPRRADYVFFPLSCLFKSLDSLASSAVNFSVKCIHVLAIKGWPKPLELDAFQQLSILMYRVLLREEKRRDDQDAFRSTLEAFSDLFDINGDLVSFNRIEMRAVTGQVLDVQLNSLKLVGVPLVQKAACRGVFSTLRSVMDRRLLSDVLPGVVSRLTATLCKPTTSKEVIVLSLNALFQLLSKTAASKCDSSADVEDTTSGAEKDQAWWKETGTQVRLAFFKIVPLCEHEKEDVVAALFELCLLVMGPCRHRLEESLHIVLQAANKASGRDDLSGSVDRRNQLLSIVGREAILRDSLARETYDHLLNMPTLVQTTSENRCSRVLQMIRLSWDILHRTGCELEGFEPLLLEGLLGTIAGSKPHLRSKPSILQVTSENSLVRQDMLTSSAESFKNLPIETVPPQFLLPLRDMITSTMLSGLFAGFKNLIQDALEISSGQRKMALLWIIARVLEYSWEDRPSAQGSSLPAHEQWRDLSVIGYEHALRILSISRFDDEYDWQLEALSFEIVAFRARELQRDFRPELADVLYRVVESVAANNEAAMVSLRLISRYCGYTGPTEALLDNNDYLVSAIAIKLDSLDLDLETLRVLDVVLRISGAALISHLGDVIDSMLSLLASFHGYAKIVEFILQVFETVIELASATVPPDLVSLIISHRAFRRMKSSRRSDVALSDLGPEPPAIEKDSPSTTANPEGDKTLENPNQSTTLAERRNSTLGSPQLYHIVLSIAQSGQHYLTHESSTIRQRVARLLQRACILLSINEDQFLPFVNDCWSLITKRLDDQELIVSIAATEASTAIFKHAGAFMSTRAEDEWSFISRLYEQTCPSAASRPGGSNERSPLSSQRWTALLDLLACMAYSVRLTDGMKQDILQKLRPFAIERPALREICDLLEAGD